jgi:hypothetical protein
MNWLFLVTALAPLVTTLVQAAEAAFSGIKNSGSVKKSVVTTGVQAVVQGMEAISTGGQKSTWEKIAGIVDPLIEDAVSVMNGLKPGTVTADAPPTSPAPPEASAVIQAT